MRTPKAALFAFVLPLILGLSALGCSNQGEGERCDHRNNNNDCESGLICTSKETLRSNSDLCCPPATQVPNVPECTPGGGGAVTTPDASTGGEGEPGNGEESDAGAAEGEDAATDAESDAPEEEDAATDAETADDGSTENAES